LVKTLDVVDEIPTDCDVVVTAVAVAVAVAAGL